jgi:hypothetical protein
MHEPDSARAVLRRLVDSEASSNSGRKPSREQPVGASGPYECTMSASDLVDLLILGWAFKAVDRATSTTVTCAGVPGHTPKPNEIESKVKVTDRLVLRASRQDRGMQCCSM